MKKHFGKIIFAVAAIAILSFTFLWGENAPGVEDCEISYAKTDTITEENTNEPSMKDITPEENEGEVVKQNDLTPSLILTDKENSADAALSASEPEKETNSVYEIQNQKLRCTLSVRCDTILDNLSWLDVEKRGLVPSDGVIFVEKEVEFSAGENAFDVLLREMTAAGIHMEFEDTPIYSSIYIEGIGNLYEFDCGELSGWMYRVNGEFPNYGCSRYELRNGDKVEFIYTCNLGSDIGGSYAAQNGN